jgi:sister chromatid cohesion protein DCC1
MWWVKSAWGFCINKRLGLASVFFPALKPSSFDLNFVLAGAYLQSDPISEDEFMTKWNTAIGDTFISNTSLKLLTVSISIPSFGFRALSYFPCAELPTDPAMRFADLSLTRERWKAEHIKLYLSDIAVDTKDLDKLLLKYARALTDKDGSWYTVRAR